MSMTLVDDLTGLFKSQALGEVASKLGESEGSVLSGFQSASAAILGGIASKAGQTGFMKQAFDLISSPLNDSKILDNVRGFFSSRTAGNPVNEGVSGKVMSMLFGGDQSKVTESISQASGLRVRSAATVMSLAAPMTLGLLGKRVQQDHLDVSTFANFMRREESGIRGFVPAGIGKTSGIVESEVAETVKSSSNSWVWPVAALCALGIGLLWFLGRQQTAHVAEQAVTQTTSAVASLGDFIKTKLANGSEVDIPRTGLEAHFLQSIASSASADSTTWFDFDRLSFDSNSATLRADSQPQLKSIAAILAAYPTLKIRIGGYTDNVGDSASNMQLSQARADSVRQELINMGIQPDRLSARGYGEQFPEADNSTEEGRARNRRIALRIMER